MSAHFGFDSLGKKRFVFVVNRKPIQLVNEVALHFDCCTIFSVAVSELKHHFILIYFVFNFNFPFSNWNWTQRRRIDQTNLFLYFSKWSISLIFQLMNLFDLWFVYSFRRQFLFARNDKKGLKTSQKENSRFQRIDWNHHNLAKPSKMQLQRNWCIIYHHIKHCTDIYRFHINNKHFWWARTSRVPDIWKWKMQFRSTSKIDFNENR